MASDLAVRLTALLFAESSHFITTLECTGFAPSTISQLAYPSDEFLHWGRHLLSVLRLDFNVVFLGLYWVYNLHQSDRNQLTTFQTKQHLLLTGLMLADKFSKDKPYAPQAWVRGAGTLSPKCIMALEFMFLDHVDYKLYVSPAQWCEWQRKLTIFAGYFESGRRRPQLPRSLWPFSAPLSSGGHAGNANAMLHIHGAYQHGHQPSRPSKADNVNSANGPKRSRAVASPGDCSPRRSKSTKIALTPAGRLSSPPTNQDGASTAYPRPTTGDLPLKK
ncbi:hypothetical protein K470DRAFT_268374 [Piedraia hortae CBS 480.64]|uniref:Cyclin N-terminal domain-containing protein n=1 Tax=Piedraia hortae CBS 480.64 TaxID=1314780 RepID=A0A6A7C6P8_9PEZI|nr:hypothetical protein K470DRAFT_268374 [Piedraia hortae CBS 480.64]